MHLRAISMVGVVAIIVSACSGALGTADGNERAPDAAPDPRLVAAETRPEPDLSRLRVPHEPWETDFGIADIDLAEIAGSVPRDGIPPIDQPVFESVEAARGWMDGRAPVIALEVNGDARAYPLSILFWHEIVNDVVGDRPLLVTFCPLCHTALVYDRVLDGHLRVFGNTGSLRYSDMVMYDRATESWWQQATGTAIIGELTGAKLDFVASQILSLDDFERAFPDGRVLSRETGHRRNYGSNPFLGYDAVDERPGRFEGAIDGRMEPKERVITVGGPDRDAIAFAYSDLARSGVVAETIDGDPIVVLWSPGRASTFDGPVVGLGEEEGSAGVFDPVLDGRELTFDFIAPLGPVVDRETGSAWSVTGLATSGELAGAQLEPVLHGNHFWFSWAAFTPDTRVWEPDPAT